MKIKPIKRQNVVALVMDQIRQLIASGDLKPGDKLPGEIELAEKFMVGRSSVREALKAFQYLGVVEVRQPKGTYITHTSSIMSEAVIWTLMLQEKNLAELIELRLSMEFLGVWKLCTTDKKYQKEKLDVLLKNLSQEIDRMKLSEKEKNLKEQLAADYNFHRNIVEQAENELFNNIYKSMKYFLMEEMYLSYSSVDRKNPVTIHQELITVLRSKNFLKITEALRKHIVIFDAEKSKKR